MKVDEKLAEAVLRGAAAGEFGLDQDWIDKFQKLSELCDNSVSRTHIAFMATSVLARATTAEADLIYIKPKLAPGNPRSYSARILSENVLVPLSAELGFSIGATGRQPLNNQPYFRMSFLGDDTPVHPGARAGFDYMAQLVGELQTASTDEARKALSAFVEVRRAYRATYGDAGVAGSLSPSALCVAIEKLVSADSEGGRRAQAVAAGMFDVVFGAPRVESGRINDPSRNYPGDVCIRLVEGEDAWIKAVEVRDKPVSQSDVQIFATRCASLGVREAAMLMVSARQPALNDDELRRWSEEFGIGLTLFYGWSRFVDEALFWAVVPKPDAVGPAIENIRARLISVEVSTGGVDLWAMLTA